MQLQLGSFKQLIPIFAFTFEKAFIAPHYDIKIEI